MFTNYEEINNYLKSSKDSKLSSFNKKLIFTKYEILGISLENLRLIAKEIMKNGEEQIVLNNKSFTYYEEILLYGFIIASIKIDENQRIEYIEKYLKLIDNWSTCDSFCLSLKVIKKNKTLYFKYIKDLLKRKNPFEIRFGIVLLMSYYLDEKNLNEIFKMLLIKNDDYYVEMALGWFFATSLSKNYDETLIFLTNNKSSIGEKVRRKIISKCNDSFRIEKEKKIEIKNSLS